MTLTMTNDEAQDWLLAQHNAAPGPPDPARFGAAIRAIRAKAVADAKEWCGLPASAAPEPTDAQLRADLRWALAYVPKFDDSDHGLDPDRYRAILARLAATPPGPDREGTR